MAQATTNTFTCPKCSRELPREAFRKDKNRTHGIDGFCKRCRRQDTQENKPRECARRKRYNDSTRYKDDPKKKAARTKAQRAHAEPKLCSVKGCVRRGERHHYLGYEKEQADKIIWLCRTCHANAHILERARRRTEPSHY